MYLKKSFNRKTGRTQLFIVEAYRDKDKKPKSRVIKTLGYLDVLEKQYDDPVKYFSQVAKQMTEARNDAFQTVQLIINTKEKQNGPARKLNFGCAALVRSYGALGLDKFFSALPQMTKIEYNLYIIFRNVACLCLLSETGFNMDDTHMLFGDFDSTLSDYNRTADLAVNHRDSLLAFIARKLTDMGIIKADDKKAIETDFRKFSSDLFYTPASAEELEQYLRKQLSERFDEELLEDMRRKFSTPSGNASLLYDSMILLRVIGYALCCVLKKELGDEYTIAEILISIRKCEYIHVNDNIYMLEYCNEILEKLGRAIHIDFTMKFRTLEDIKTLVNA